MNTSARALFSSRPLRRILIALLLVIPVVTLWNLTVASYNPSFKVTFGPRLRGVTEARPPVVWSFDSFADGSLQKALTDAVNEAIPVRPLLVRLSNSFRKRLFGLYGAPGVVAGDDGQLIETNYLREYCARDLSVLRAKAAEWIPRLKELQDDFEARGRQLVYLTTPSKAAYMPEKFMDHYACASPERDRREYLPVYRQMLIEGGIRLVDGASMTHGLRGRYDVDLFPLGGVHWNQLGVVHAADAILEQINRRAGREIAPRLKWTYEVTDRPTGTDTDLADVVNVLFARPRYPVPKLTFAPTKPCSEWPVSKLKVAFIGGSFIHDLARMLIAHGCLSGLSGHSYLRGTVRGGEGYVTIQERMSSDDVKRLRETDIVILEENEAGLPGMMHSNDFHAVLLRN